MNSLKNQTKTRLKDSVCAQLAAKPVLQALLAEHFRVSTFTINRWIKANDPYLCFMEPLAIISRELGIQPHELTHEISVKEEGVEL